MRCCPICDRAMTPTDELMPMLLYGNEYRVDGKGVVCADCTQDLKIDRHPPAKPQQPKGNPHANR